MVKLVEVEHSAHFDSVFDCFEDAYGGRIQVSIKRHDELLVSVRPFVPRQGLAEPASEEFDAFVLEGWCNPADGEGTCRPTWRPTGWQTFKTVKPVEFAFGIAQKLRPVEEGRTVSHAKFEIEHTTVCG